MQDELFMHRGNAYEIIEVDYHDNPFSEQSFKFYKYRDERGIIMWIDSLYTRKYYKY